jgi:hypothetical protein
VADIDWDRELKWRQYELLVNFTKHWPVARQPAKKPDRQLDLPASPPETITRVLPTQLRIGDRLTGETGEYEVVGRPYTPPLERTLTCASGESTTPRSR